MCVFRSFLIFCERIHIWTHTNTYNLRNSSHGTWFFNSHAASVLATISNKSVDQKLFNTVDRLSDMPFVRAQSLESLGRSKLTLLRHQVKDKSSALDSIQAWLIYLKIDSRLSCDRGSEHFYSILL